MTLYQGWSMGNEQSTGNYIRRLQADIQRLTSALDTAEGAEKKVLIANLKQATKALEKELRAQRREDESNYADQEDLSAFARGR